MQVLVLLKLQFSLGIYCFSDQVFLKTKNKELNQNQDKSSSIQSLMLLVPKFLSALKIVIQIKKAEQTFSSYQGINNLQFQLPAQLMFQSFLYIDLFNSTDNMNEKSNSQNFSKFPIDLILINILLSSKRERPLLTPLLQLDTTCLPTLQNIQAECKNDDSSQAKLLANRATKLENIVIKVLQNYETQQQSITHKMKDQRKEQMNVQRRGIVAEKVKKNKKCQHYVNKKKIQLEKNGNKLSTQEVQNHKNLSQLQYDNEQSQDENINKSNFYNNKDDKKSVQPYFGLCELKKSEYQTYIPMNQYLQQYHPKIYSKQVTVSQTNKVQETQDGQERKQGNKQSNGRSSVSPKVQRKEKSSSLNNSGKVMFNKLYETSKRIKIGQKEKISQTFNIQVQTDDKIKINSISSQFANGKQKKQQELQKMQKIVVECKNQSIDLLVKLMEQNSQNFNKVNKQITEIKEVISEIGQSQESRLQEKIQSIQNSILWKNNSICYNLVNKNAQQEAVEEEQLWECEQQQLQEQIKAINKQISSRILEKVVIDKTNPVEVPKTTNFNENSQIIYKNNGTKLVKLTLTPDKCSNPSIFNAQIDVRSQNGYSQSKSNKNIKKPNINDYRKLAPHTPTQYKYQTDRTPKNYRNYQEAEQSQDFIEEKPISKWQKKNNKKDNKKQLLSMKIQKLRQ